MLAYSVRLRRRICSALPEAVRSATQVGKARHAPKRRRPAARRPAGRFRPSAASRLRLDLLEHAEPDASIGLKLFEVRRPGEVELRFRLVAAVAFCAMRSKTGGTRSANARGGIVGSRDMLDVQRRM